MSSAPMAPSKVASFLSQRGERVLWLGHGENIAGMRGDFPKQNFRKEVGGPQYMNISQVRSSVMELPLKDLSETQVR
jgi:hypothetical protein